MPWIEIITDFSENHIAYIFIVVSLSGNVANESANGVTKNIWDNIGEIKLHNINVHPYLLKPKKREVLGGFRVPRQNVVLHFCLLRYSISMTRNYYN